MTGRLALEADEDASAGGRRWASVRAMLQSAEDSAAGQIELAVPSALARVVEELRPGPTGKVAEALAVSGQLQPLTVTVPFGPVLRPAGEVFVPSPLDKRQLRQGGCISRLIFFAITPGFALDVFLLTPGVLHLAGVADIFEPGRPTQLVVALRVLRLARAFKLLRYTPGSQQLLTVVQGKLEALVTSLLICFSFSLVLASGVFAAEFGTNPEFSSMLGAVWFAIVTVTTVGFGDVVPETALGRVCGALLALTGTALYALPPAIVATGYLEHRDLDRRAKMAAFEKLFDRKRGLVLRSAFKRLRARAKNATRLLAKALRRQHAAEAEAMRAMAAGESVDGRGRNIDATELELITAQRLFQQRSPGSLGGLSADGSEATMAGRRGADASHPAMPYPLRQDSTRRGFMGQSGRTGFHGSSGRGGLVGDYGRGIPSFVSHSTNRTNTKVTNAAKALLIACKGELSASIRALVDAERWAVSPEAAGDDTSLPDLVRLQTHNHALLD